ncbi:MAG: YicC family protein [Prevotella sp.]|nr:YicC family protein [Prevotella sp.]
MLLSMTGYGKAVATYKEKKIHVEVRALNSKNFDCQTRIAPIYREREIEIRRMIQASVVRGKIDFSIWIESDTTGDVPTINMALVKNYHAQLKAMQQEIGAGEVTIPEMMQMILRMPDVMSHDETVELTDEEWAAAQTAINEALNNLHDFRAQEGAALRKKFEEKLDNIARLAKEIEPWEQSRVEKIRTRIVESLRELPDVEYDQNRLEQELIYYIEKLDISEEKQRLANHLKYFRETMDEPQSQGKKLGFIAQEMGREINTTGSKSNQAEMQNIVVQMKDELEQIKEQVLNAL